MNSYELSIELLKRPSITPDDAGCQALLSKQLGKNGFTIRDMPYGPVKNLWATHGNGAPVLCFAGHTDVVPAGEIKAWLSDPFIPSERDGMLYGRGAADMKAPIAAMCCAAIDYVAQNPDHKGTVALLITSDEEGVAIDGTRKVIEALIEEKQAITYCVVGEPTSNQTLGDCIRVGRRGSLTGRLTVNGKQGHIAYPHRITNPMHKFAPALKALTETTWDEGYESFPATSFQFSSIHSGVGADNVVPGKLEAVFNFRYSPAVTAIHLRESVETVLKNFDLDFMIDWHHSGDPYYTAPGKLRDVMTQAIEKELGQSPDHSTAGGTSDGRFIAKTGSQVVEFGPINASIHQVNEHIAIDDIKKIETVYFKLCEALLS